jgi:hypothetical protein
VDVSGNRVKKRFSEDCGKRRGIEIEREVARSDTEGEETIEVEVL